MTKLFVFGCSFTKGSGCLEGEPYTLKYKKSDKDLIWPEILAEELNLKLYNFGEPGKSNGRIIDSIIENFELIQKHCTRDIKTIINQMKNINDLELEEFEYWFGLDVNKYINEINKN